MKLSAYHYAVALRGLVAGTRYTLPMSWPVATDYLIPLEACTLSPDPPDAAALEPFLMLMVIHPHQVPDALFMFLGPVGWRLRLYPPEQTSDGVATVHDLDSLADALGLVAVTILSSKSFLAEAKRQGFCPPRATTDAEEIEHSQDATPNAQLPNAAGRAVSGPDQTQNAAPEMANKPRRAPETDELVCCPFPVKRAAGLTWRAETVVPQQATAPECVHFFGNGLDEHMYGGHYSGLVKLTTASSLMARTTQPRRTTVVKHSTNLLELLRKRGMDRDGDFLREALRVLVGRITVDGKTGAASAFSATGSVSQL